ncbi:M43 family zinc metalloprotease [Tenacibaculum aiptasiae]|uniref:M43 family zinc metalloprotease n=1 Tax=Tenacibaculum aiptasiae TaxID=426481 RepID=UPI003B58EC1A
MNRKRISLVLLFTILCIANGISQKRISELLKNKSLELNKVEEYVLEKKIIPPQCGSIYDINLVNTELNANKNTASTSYDDSKYVINVFFHIVNKDDGTREVPIEESNIIEAITILNNKFNQFDIFFKFKGFNHINNSNKLTIFHGLQGQTPFGTFNELIQYSKDINKYQDNSFNIFIVDKIFNNNIQFIKYSGMAHRNGVNTVIDDEYLLTSTLPHEIGHNLSLLHTYHNWNSSNCELAHANDNIDDTAPSTTHDSDEVSSDCSTYVGPNTNSKCNIEFSNIPANNFMSSNTLPCRSLNNAVFTKGQGAKMRATIKENLDTKFARVMNSLESLYEPYSSKIILGEVTHTEPDPNNFGYEIVYRTPSNAVHKFQKGFDYEFYYTEGSCNAPGKLRLEHTISKDEDPEDIGYVRAVRIKQLGSNITVYTCLGGFKGKNYSSVPITSVTITSKESLGDSYSKTQTLRFNDIRTNPYYQRELPPNKYYFIKKVLENGMQIKKTIYKIDI